MRCSKGHESPDHLRFCILCGEQLAEQAPVPSTPQPAPAPARVCPQGHPLPAQQVYCSQCGSTVRMGSAAPSPVNPAQSLPPFMPPPPPPPSSHVVRNVLIAVAAVVAVGLIGFVTQASRGPEMVPLTIEYVVYDDDGCDHGFGYADVPGSQVTIEKDGVIVATSSVPYVGDEALFFSCTYNINVGLIPADGASYSVTIGRRGTLSYTNAEMVAQNWSLAFSLGG